MHEKLLKLCADTFVKSKHASQLDHKVIGCELLDHKTSRTVQ